MMSELNMDFIERAAELFRTKIGMTRENFNELVSQMKVRAFTVSYIESVDKIREIQNILVDIIRDGGTLRDFRQRSIGLINTTPWHLETVFRTNVQSAYGAAKWERVQSLKSLSPYGRYSAVMDGRTRPQHAKLHGLVYPLNHPFWRSYWPPWDYNCRCHVKTLTQYEVERSNIKIETAIPDVRVSTDFISPAMDGLKVNPAKMLQKGTADMPSDVAIEVYFALMSGIEEITGLLMER